MAGLLRDLGVDEPHVALAALNPHAGEGGLMGDEEIEILRPAVEAARSDGVQTSAARCPADAVFHQGHEGRFDGVISLYHDQGHVASKTLDFFGTVSATLGLPVIRTSVDHGTAFDLAGKWKADARGQIAALRVGAQLAPGALACSRVSRAQRERERLAVGARTQRLVLHRSPAGTRASPRRWRPGRVGQQRRRARRAADGGERAGVGLRLHRLGQRERAVDQLAGPSALGSATHSVASPAVEITLAVVEAS